MQKKPDLKNLVILWAKRDGRHVVLSALVKNKISDSMAIQLTRGYYKSEPKGAIREIIENELRNAGYLSDKGDDHARRGVKRGGSKYASDETR